ncbi:uncharacterized protein A4U43_C08F2390 [Asparagus officinalis]|nr:uncharacterized protein A4U43_C08F2390 [Asparagus officinalis]
MSSGDLLRIQPSELKFPFELKKQSSCCMQLTNKTDQYVAFKVKTTNPKKYCVRPNAGIVLPGSTCDVTVTMQAQKEAPLDMQCKDKFLLQSVVAEHGATLKDITPEMVTRNYEAQSKEKSSEASALISKLTEDKTSALQQNQKLRQELDLLRKELHQNRGGFSVMFVAIVGLLSALVGYMLRRT